MVVEKTLFPLLHEGVDMQGVTVWSLLGAYDWNSLLSQDGAHYESGVFDMSGGEPRPTALVKMIRGLANEGQYEHPVLASKGWWEREERFLYHHHCPTSPSTLIAES